MMFPAARMIFVWRGFPSAWLLLVAAIPATRPGLSSAGKSRRAGQQGAGRFQITAHALDGLLKHEAEFLADALSTHFHLPIPRIIRPFPTELPQLDLHIERLDDVFETEGDALLHMEHQSTYTPDTLPRFLQYDAALHRATKKAIYTVVIYGPNVRRAPTSIRMPGWTYRVHNIYLGRRDGERVYQLPSARYPYDAGTPLTSGQRIDLVFQPLMHGRNGDPRRRCSATRWNRQVSCRNRIRKGP